MSAKRTVTFSLSKAKDCVDDQGRKILSITVSSTDGRDEMYAAKRAEAKDTNVTEELIRVSLLKYTVKGTDGKDETITCAQPYEALDNWGTKARNFVVAGFKSIAIPGEDEFADFFASASEE